MSCPSQIVAVTHNAWLIPFGGAWSLGRAARVANHIGKATRRLEIAHDRPTDRLTIVAVQEAWAFRCGPFWPLVALLARAQARLLRRGLVRGGREPLVLRLVGWLVLSVPTLLASWLPLRAGTWCPKHAFSDELGDVTPHVIGAAPGASLPLWRWPPALMDSGLLLLASRAPDATGFVAYSTAGNSEATANKGMLWARFGGLVVVTTHMTAVRADREKSAQRAQLASLVARLLFGGRAAAVGGRSAGGDAGGARQVLVLGDMNHAHGVTTPSDTASSCDTLLHALEAAAPLRARRLSGDESTSTDGAIDHVIACGEMSEHAAQYEMVSSEVIPDPRWDISDHQLLGVVLRRSGTWPI